MAILISTSKAENKDLKTRRLLQLNKDCILNSQHWPNIWHNWQLPLWSSKVGKSRVWLNCPRVKICWQEKHFLFSYKINALKWGKLCVCFEYQTTVPPKINTSGEVQILQRKNCSQISSYKLSVELLTGHSLIGIGDHSTQEGNFAAAKSWKEI